MSDQNSQSGIDRIAAERQRQIDGEGYSALRDDSYTNGELARAASCFTHDARENRTGSPDGWPWMESFWKPADPADGIDGRIRELEKGGALIAAEIDRLLRMKARGEA